MKPLYIRGLAVGAVVCVLAIAAYYAFVPEKEIPQKADAQQKESGAIKEVEPAPIPKEPPVKRELTEAEKRQKEIERYEKIFAGREMPEGIKTRIYFLKNPPTNTYTVQVPHQYLQHESERDIASVVLVEPGTEFLDVLSYGQGFDQDFVNAMLDKIEIKDDDDEETRRIKEGVIAAKNEIASICKAEGKKPSEVMNEQAKLMYDLGKFNRDLVQELHDKRMDPNVSDADLQDFFRAANKMREERGLAPIKVPSFAGRTLMLSRRAARQAAAEAAGNEQ